MSQFNFDRLHETNSTDTFQTFIEDKTEELEKLKIYAFKKNAAYLINTLSYFINKYESMTVEEQAHPYGRYVSRIAGVVYQALRRSDYTRATYEEIKAVITNTSLLKEVVAKIHALQQQAIQISRNALTDKNETARIAKVASSVLGLRHVEINKDSLVINGEKVPLKNVFNLKTKLEDDQRLFDNYWAMASTLLQRHVGGRRRREPGS